MGSYIPGFWVFLGMQEKKAEEKQGLDYRKRPFIGNVRGKINAFQPIKIKNINGIARSDPGSQTGHTEPTSIVELGITAAGETTDHHMT